MITVHKLKGEEMWVNPDLIAFIEGGHESRLTFLDGHHIIISDDPEDVAEAVRLHRARVLALAFHFAEDGVGGQTTVATRRLKTVPDPED